MVPLSQAEGAAGHQVARLGPGRVGDIAVLLDHVLPQGGGRPQRHQQIEGRGRPRDRDFQRAIVACLDLNGGAQLLDRRLAHVLGERQVGTTLDDLRVVGGAVVGGQARVHQALDRVDEVVGGDRLAVLPHRVLTQVEGVGQAVIADPAVLAARHLGSHVRRRLTRDRIEAEQSGEQVLGHRHRRRKISEAGVDVVGLPIQRDPQRLVLSKIAGDRPSIPASAGSEGHQRGGG